MALPRAVSLPGTFEPEHHHLTKHTIEHNIQVGK
jgi:hypothetical protein